MAMLFHTTDDGCRLAYTLTGPETAPAIVLAGSLGTDHTLWDRQADAFAERYRVLRYDTRGHGASDAPGGDYPIDRLGCDVLSLMDGAGLNRAHVCGVSIGGLTALWLGIHAPDRVHRLVLANTAAKVGSLEFWAERMRLARAEGLGALADTTMEGWVTERFRRTEPEVVERMRATLVQVPVAGYLGCCAALRDADLRDLAARVQAPSLVVTGTADVATPPAAGAALAAAIPGAGLFELDAAHLSNLERAPEFTRAVLDFLEAAQAAEERSLK
jgi:3-oxoadipate enol-lactonase